jgi:pyrroline-5-carboxylate reductase
MTAPIWLLGCGHMGGALLRRWLAEDIGPVAIIDPEPRALPPGETAQPHAPDGAPDILVIAVKPQAWAQAVAPFAGRIGAGTMVISVMAGITTAQLKLAFPHSVIVRAMPNTPAAIGQGATALFSDGGDLVQGAAEALFSPAGATVWLADEAQFDAVTALSGSGPAYVFAFIEALAAAGAKAGLEPALAMRLARATVIGAAALAAHEPARSAAELREAVTSPGGTTAAGLAELRPGLAPVVTRTLLAATSRSRELSGALPG